MNHSSQGDISYYSFLINIDIVYFKSLNIMNYDPLLRLYYDFTKVILSVINIYLYT